MSTPNMVIAYPSPSVTPGPQWASLLNASFDTVDVHDHTSGKGVKVPSAGLNINADLSMGSYNLTGLRSLRLDNQLATLATASDLRIIYSKNGELAYRDASGNEVILTNAGSVAGATGTISGLSSPASASFNSLTGIYSFLKDTSKPGKFVTSDLLVYEFNNATANPITVKSPASLAAAYSLTLPAAVPVSTSFLTIDSSGVMASVGSTGTGSVVLADTPTFSGTPAGVITGNSYSPTITYTKFAASVASATLATASSQALYARIGKTVTVWFRASVTITGWTPDPGFPSNSALYYVEITLPISTTTLSLPIGWYVDSTNINGGISTITNTTVRGSMVFNGNQTRAFQLSFTYDVN